MSSDHRLLAAQAKEALVLKLAGRLHEAIEGFESVLREAPDWDYGSVAMDLAQCYEQIGDLVKAKEYYKNALSLWPDYDIYVNNYAIFLSEHGSPDEALPYLIKACQQKALQGNTEDTQYLRELIQQTADKGGLSKEEIEQLLPKP